MITVTSSFSKGSGFRQNVFDQNEKPVFQISSSGLKSTFEKLCFRDGLVWTVDLTGEIKLHFQISVRRSLCGRGFI